MFEKLLSESVLLGTLLGIVALIFLDVLVKIAVCIKRGCFDWKAILDFLRTNVIPYVVSYGAIEAVLYAASKVPTIPSGVVDPFVAVAAIVYALILAKLIHSIYDSLRELGIPIEEDGDQ